MDIGYFTRKGRSGELHIRLAWLVDGLSDSFFVGWFSLRRDEGRFTNRGRVRLVDGEGEHGALEFRLNGKMSMELGSIHVCDEMDYTYA